MHERILNVFRHISLKLCVCPISIYELSDFDYARLRSFTLPMSAKNDINIFYTLTIFYLISTLVLSFFHTFSWNFGLDVFCFFPPLLWRTLTQLVERLDQRSGVWWCLRHYFILWKDDLPPLPSLAIEYLFYWVSFQWLANVLWKSSDIEIVDRL